MSNPSNEKTSPKLALAYSMGEVGCQMSWYMINTYLTLFYTDIVGLSASAISLIMLIARVWGAVNDPMMGNIADRTNTRWGKFRPYLFFAPPVLAVFNILTFAVFPVQGAAKVVLCLICYIGTGMAYTACSIAYQALQNDTASSSEKLGFLASVKEIVKNDQLLMVVLSTVLGTICVTGRMGLLSFYIIYVGGGYTVVATVYTTMTIAQLIGNFFIPWGTKTFTKKGYLIILNVAMCIGFFLMYINPTSNLPYLLGVSFLCGLCNSAASICFGMVSDSIEYGDWKLGRRQEGIAASMLSFGVKISTAICGSAGVLLLSAAGYVAGAEQTEAAKTGINVVVNLLPLVIAALSMIPLFFYKLTPSKVAEIRTDLDAGKHAWDK